jgi:hypothetical protein
MARWNSGRLFHKIPWRWQEKIDMHFTKFKILTPEGMEKRAGI